MDDSVLAGIIAAESDPPGLDRARFLALIGEHGALEADADEATAVVVINGEPSGRLLWSSTDANEIEVYGDVDRVRDVAWNIAAALGGHFITLAELTSC